MIITSELLSYLRKRAANGKDGALNGRVDAAALLCAAVQATGTMLQAVAGFIDVARIPPAGAGPGQLGVRVLTLYPREKAA